MHAGITAHHAIHNSTHCLEFVESMQVHPGLNARMSIVKLAHAWQLSALFCTSSIRLDKRDSKWRFA